jgi:hypothetical protein
MRLGFLLSGSADVHNMAVVQQTVNQAPAMTGQISDLIDYQLRKRQADSFHYSSKS